MDAINFISAARIRVLLVPVGPIQRTVFEQHAKMLGQYCTVKLEDVSMGLRSDNAVFSQQAPHDGQLHIHFVTSYNGEHRYLEEFQLHRRVFGVIGIMDCREWVDRNMQAGYEEFQQVLTRYPSAVASQCFAFDPLEQQTDGPRGGGVIMIPNIKTTKSIINMLVCDLAHNILTELESMAVSIAKRQEIESPSPGISIYPQGGVPRRNGSPLPPPAHTSSPDLNNGGARPLTAPPSAMTTTGSSSVHNRSLSSAGFASMAGTGYTQPTVVTDQRLRRRTAARAQKLLGDIYLMAGRLTDAVSSYQTVIEATRSNSDFLWHGSALEGLYCAVVLLAYLQADLSQIHQQQLQQITSTPMSPTTSEHPRIQPTTPTIKPLIVDIPEKYQTILALYNKVPQNGTPPVLFVEASMKVTKFIATCYVCGDGILDDRALAAVVSGNMYVPEPTSDNVESPTPATTASPQPASLQRQRSTLRSRSASITTPSFGVTRADIMVWVMKAWNGRMDELWIIDQIHVTTTIASILGAIQFRRKQSLFLRYAVRMIAPLLHQSRLARAAATTGSNGSKAPPSDRGVLECLKQICDVFGVGKDYLGQSSAYLEHGWPELQIDVLYECIRIAEAVPDYKEMTYYTTTLLQQLHAYLSREEQAGLYASLSRILAVANQNGIRDLTEVQYWTDNLIVDIEVCPPSARKMPFTRAKDGIATLNSSAIKAPVTTSTGEIDPFIYNPFQRKVANAAKLDLVAGEASYFIVTLTNPHGIDLEIQDIRLSTSGVGFHAASTSTVIPAHTTVSIKVNGTPEAAGSLQIRGCHVKIAHCAEREFKVMNKNSAALRDRIGDDYMSRSKKSGLDSFKTQVRTDVTPAAAPTTEPAFVTIAVIPPQPLLKIKNTSLQHGSLMLFEGEKTTITLTLENIGMVPVDFVTMMFTDSTSQLTLGNNNVDLSAEDAYELELFLKVNNVFGWNRNVECHIPVGATKDVNVEVLGKRGCSSGVIQLDYGYLHRPKEEEQSDYIPPANTFVTRQMFSQVLMTVYKTVEALNLDVLYLQSHGGMEIPTTVPNSPTLNGDVTLSPESTTTPKLDFSEDGFLAPPVNKADQPPQFKPQARRGSKSINKRLSSNFAKVDRRQSVEELLSRSRGDAVLPGEQIETAISRRVALGTKNEYCLLTLDVRNVWTVPVEVAMLVDDSEEGQGLDVDKLIKSTTMIQPGSTQRIILPVRRLALSVDHISRPIPSLTTKQFVVARGAVLTADEQLQERSLFWFREELLKRVVARWTCKDNSGRFGKFDLRTLRLTKSMLNVLKIEDISYLVTVEPTEPMPAVAVDGAASTQRGLEQIGSNRWKCPVEKFVQIRVTVVNRSDKDVKLCLRMQPVQVNGDGTMEYDLGQKMAWHGVLQAPLAKLEPDSTTSYTLPVCFFSRGEFKVLYHSEDVRRRVVFYDHEPLVIEAF